MKKYFYSFVGAIMIRNGLSEAAIQVWISALIQWSAAAAAAAASANIVGQPATDGHDGQGNVNHVSFIFLLIFFSLLSSKL